MAPGDFTPYPCAEDFSLNLATMSILQEALLITISELGENYNLIQIISGHSQPFFNSLILKQIILTGFLKTHA
jgi:hypothetical protein